MVRGLTVLVALLAQGMFLMSPVCLVRCVSPSGHECLELVGQECRCCEVSAEACCDHLTGTCADHQEADDLMTTTVTLADYDDCGCQHSAMDSLPQLRVKSLSTDQAANAQVVWLPAWSIHSLKAAAFETARLQPSLLRPQDFAHLTVLATVLLRV